MHLSRSKLLLGVAAAGLLAGCDVPLTPKWDVPMYLPLTTQPIHLDSTFTFGFIPPGVSDTVSFPPQLQDVSGALQDMLSHLSDPSHCTLAANPALSCNTMMVTVTKHTAIQAQDTLFVAPDSAALFAPPNAAVPYTSTSNGIVFPIAVAAADTLVADTINISQASMGMLKAAGDSSHVLWIQFRGRVGNPSSSSITITSADSIGIALAVTISVAVSHR